MDLVRNVDRSTALGSDRQFCVDAWLQIPCQIGELWMGLELGSIHRHVCGPAVSFTLATWPGKSTEMLVESQTLAYIFVVV